MVFSRKVREFRESGESDRGPASEISRKFKPIPKPGVPVGDLGLAQALVCPSQMPTLSLFLAPEGMRHLDVAAAQAEIGYGTPKRSSLFSGPRSSFGSGSGGCGGVRRLPGW
jgi:hypothetical protein